jgi:hypothetical protein
MCRNHSFSGDTAEHATRFIGLAKVGNKLKHKWLYAFSLAPTEQMRATDLCQQTTDQTDCPYTGNMLHPSLSKKQVLNMKTVVFWKDGGSSVMLVTICQTMQHHSPEHCSLKVVVLFKVACHISLFLSFFLSF